MMLVRYSEPIGVLHAAHHYQSSAQPGKQHNHNNDHCDEILIVHHSAPSSLLEIISAVNYYKRTNDASQKTQLLLL
jgi:hypothetical protein